jgi:DNA repair photolyase
MDLEFQEYRARKIVNVYKHADAWFWNKYSANPYVGCRNGCEFCYQRGSGASRRYGPEAFDTLIRVKTNAAELLRKELSKLAPDVISCGDWQQPAEGRYQLSRQMLEVVRDLRFPLFVIERSPLLTRDLDLLVEIKRQTWASVLLSMSNVDPALKRAFEPRSPGLKQRLQAMEKLASAGIPVGTALMPIIPYVGDDEAHLEDAIRAIKDHGGSFVVAGGLSMGGVHAERALRAAKSLDPALEARWRRLYRLEEGGKTTYWSPQAYIARVALMVRELCARHGLKDRMPRYIAPGPLATNKRIAEQLALKTYDLELEEAKTYRVWAYRKAGWVVDEHPVSVAEIYRERGEEGLRDLPGIGKNLSRVIAKWLKETVN